MKILMERHGISWQGSEFDCFHLGKNQDGNSEYAHVDGIVFLHFRSLRIAIKYKCDDMGHTKYKQYDPQDQSDRMMAVRPFFPKGTIFVFLRHQPVSRYKQLACSPTQKDLCREVAHIITTLVKRAKDKEIAAGEKHIIFFAFERDNRHVIQAKRDCQQKGLWTTVTEHRPRTCVGGNKNRFSSKSLVTRQDLP